MMMMMICPFVSTKKKLDVKRKEEKKRKFSINHLHTDEVFFDEPFNFPFSSTKSKSPLSSPKNKYNSNLKEDSNDLDVEHIDNFLSMLHPSIFESL